MAKTSLLKERIVYKPFEYQEASDFWLQQQQAHWLHTEVPMMSDLADWNSNKKFLMGEMKAYTAVQYNAIHMVNALLTDDMITFYEIYEAFDKLEIWHSQYEKVSTAQLQSLNDNIRSLIRTTEESTNRIVDGLGDLTYRMAKQNDNLKEIHGAVTAGNLLSAINTFQLHRISKNTKSLRE